MKVEIYSDVICPWCYIGERRFSRALATYPGATDASIVFRPFQLDPHAPNDPVPLLDALRTKFGPQYRQMIERVSRAAAGEGIEIDWEDAIAVNTFTAHRALRLAEREYSADAQRALAEQLFEAHFALGEDVSDHEVLVAHAASVGMDGDRLRDYLTCDDTAADLESQLAHARGLGVSAVPTFVFDDEYAVEGAQSPEVFHDVFARFERAES